MLRCVIIDDEPAARHILQTYVEDATELKLMGSCKNALEARKLLKKHPIDLIFLDINMPRLSGIEFLKSLQHPPKVILTTAYSEYALQSYELNVTDYLLKPFSFNRFLKAVDKVWESINKTTPTESFMTVKADGKLYRLRLEDILFVEGKGDYVTIHAKEQKITYYQTLKNLCEQLPDADFCRIHKSYIVSMDEINYVEGNQVSIQEQKLPIGNAYKASFLEKYAR